MTARTGNLSDGSGVGLALRVEEAAAALGVSDDHFRGQIAPELSWTRRGRVRIVAVSELQRWLEDSAERVIERAACAIIRVRAPSGVLRTFDADSVEIADGLVTAIGRWRGQHQPRSYTWPRNVLVEIRYREAVAA